MQPPCLLRTMRLAWCPATLHDAQSTPADFWGLLQVHGILQHKDWEARTAAGYCLGLNAEHV